MARIGDEAPHPLLIALPLVEGLADVVEQGVLADQARGVGFPAVERHLDLLLAGDDVMVGDDVTARRYEEARAKRHSFTVGFWRRLVLLVAELVFVFVEPRQATEGIEGAIAFGSLHLGGDLYADDSRAHPLDQVGKAHRRA